MNNGVLHNRWLDSAARVEKRSVSARIMQTLVVTLALLCVTGFAVAQDPGFVLLGEGGLVTALVLDPSAPATVYAATARGLFKSLDGGTSWHPVGKGLQGHSLLGLATDPLSPSRLYATTDTGGVYRSADGGENWTASSEGLGARYVGAIAVDPHHPGTLYAGAETGLIFKSTDAAATWFEMGLPIARVTVSTIAFDPTTPDTLYVGTNGEGVLTSSDGGLAWTRPVGRLKKGSVWTIAAGHGSPTTLYAGTHDGLFPQPRPGRRVDPAEQRAQELERSRARLRALRPLHGVRRDGGRDPQVYGRWRELDARGERPVCLGDHDRPRRPPPCSMRERTSA